MLNQDRFIACVRSLAYCAHTIQSGYADRGSKVSIRTSAGRSFMQLETQLRGQCCCLRKKRRRPRSPLHRWTVHSANYRDAALLVDWTQHSELLFYLFRVRGLGEPEIYMDPGFLSHHISQGSAADHSRIDCEPGVEIGKRGDPLQLPPKLEHRTVAIAEIDARMGRNAPHPD